MNNECGMGLFKLAFEPQEVLVSPANFILAGVKLAAGSLREKKEDVDAH